MNEIIIREENEITDQILDEDLKLVDITVMIHDRVLEELDIQELIQMIKEEHNLRVVYIHKFTSNQKLSIGVKEIINRSERNYQ